MHIGLHVSWRRWVAATVVVGVAGLGLPGPACAQEPATSFDQLGTRLKPGDRVWVTDAKGREVEGRIERLTANSLTMDTDTTRTFADRDVSLIRKTKPDSLWNGTLIGLGIGGGLASAWCLGAALDDSPDVNAGVECAEGFVVFGSVGTLLGLFVDAARVGKGLVLFRAPGWPGGPGHARLSIAPVITPRRKGVALSISF